MPNSKASSTTWPEQFVTANDGEARAWFGLGAAISGKTAFIAAKNASVDGRAGQGAVYVFENVNGVWTQTAKLVASDGAANDQFGTAIALSGSHAVITASLAKVNGNTWQGAAYVFSIVQGVWKQQAKLVAGHGAAFDTFGTSVAMHGTSLFIGSGGVNQGGVFLRRLVYVFRTDPAQREPHWVERQTLNAPDQSDPTSSFGTAMAIGDVYALIGARSSTISGVPGKGEVYVYIETNGSWLLSSSIVAEDGSSRDNFGSSVALDGLNALIGAPGATIDGKVSQGAVYHYQLSHGVWAFAEKLVAKDGQASSLFGASVSVSGPLALITAYAAKNYTGSAYIYQRVSGAWIAKLELQASNGVAGDVFGYFSALDSATALVGAYSRDVNGRVDQGAAYFYTGASIGPHP
ncbi:MAG: hypothetical protein ABIR62_11860 [Dokdonella sp.]|uniref:hypothetical protein n=1 Tax=Dokdonella sp. TaxID=2291710 RepID=UPI00326432AC